MAKETYVKPELKIERLNPEEALLCTTGSGTNDYWDWGICWRCFHWRHRNHNCWCGCTHST